MKINREEVLDSLKNEGFFRYKAPKHEVNHIRKEIHRQFLMRLQFLDIDLVKDFINHPLDQYHTVCQKIDHSSTWPKTVRVFSPSYSKIFQSYEFMGELENILGEYTIADGQFRGWEDINWRLVRPGKNDVGPWHADRWFWECHNSVNFAPGWKRLKVWMAIDTVPGKNDLQVLNKSHVNEYKWKPIHKYGERKPTIDEEVKQEEILDLKFDSGDMILFNERLVHRGQPNLTEKTRVSVEFIMLINDSQNQLDLEGDNIPRRPD